MSRIRKDTETPVEPEPSASKLPQYREVPERPRFQETDPVVREEILAMMQKLKSQFEVVSPSVRARAVETFKRCPECATGKFVHLGVRFCGACYGRL